MDDFSISLESLEHGWACLVFSDGARCERFSVSYVGADALSGVIDTALHLSVGQGSTVQFHMEPEMIPYRMDVNADGTFLLMVQDSSFRGSALRYIRQVLKMFDQYAYAYGESEYKNQWGYAYPAEKLERLRMALRPVRENNA